ncbi:MAG: phenylalanine--tRNA ligase subunit alpha [Firmicutes bacterium]|uniref:Phenylalanine--tRNA ligase alpha subunit n=1 Tax=Candidatus Onthovivens merdipullorum TaxID=2840889 RepID=A0A9D9DIU3_9BACL|nr:phenylalanine--tRNA ligase subunit alpha [Candidatus Onthovivens merdipullorum]
MEKFKEILTELESKLNNVNSLNELVEIRNEYLSKKGIVSSLMSKMKELTVEEKKTYGKEVNELKTSVEKLISEKQIKVNEIEQEKRFKEEKIDISLPPISHHVGKENPFYKIIDEIEEIFIGMGYKVEKGPEVDKDHFVFELLNIPKDHPARDMQDTLYIDNETLLRSHTSAVQAHVMQKEGGKPIKIICPGKTYRRDDDDMTHSHQFAQVEGLVIDKNINLGNLKATLELFAKKMFSKDSKIRFRSSYFPFTEPSVEVDVSCFNCHGKGCNICKNSGWIEILGAGMVHPNVLKMNGYNPEVYSGFAFGIGIERVAMLRYGIDDIRRFYQNDIRFIDEFNKKVED